MKRLLTVFTFMLVAALLVVWSSSAASASQGFHGSQAGAAAAVTEAPITVTDSAVDPNAPTPTRSIQQAVATASGTEQRLDPPATLDDLLAKYPDLKPYLDSVKDAKLTDMDLSDFYAKVAEIFKNSGASGVGVFLQDSGLLDKLNVPLSYLDLFSAYDQGGLDAVVKLAKDRKIINDKDELGGYLGIDDAANVDAVKADLGKLGVSTYNYSDDSGELEIGIPSALLSQFQTPGELIDYLTKIAHVAHVVSYRAPEPSIKPAKTS